MESRRDVSVRTLPGWPRWIPLLVVLIAGMPWLPGCGSDGNPAVSENVALSSGTALHRLTDLWLTAWHASPVHCSNQLNPVFNRAGVSVGVKDVRYATVVVFGQKAGG